MAQNDPSFVHAGAMAFRTDLSDAQVELLDTGHLATETHVVDIAAAMRECQTRERTGSR